MKESKDPSRGWVRDMLALECPSPVCIGTHPVDAFRRAIGASEFPLVRRPWGPQLQPAIDPLCLLLPLQALLETALTRVVLPMPILVLPPMIMSLLEK